LAVHANDTEAFNHHLVRSIEASLKKILGEVAGEAFLRRLEKQHLLKRADIPFRLEEFETMLGRIFGSRSASIIGNFMMQEFYSRLGLKYERAGKRGNLIEDVVMARDKVLQG
jgi:hypothetical protein